LLSILRLGVKARPGIELIPVDGVFMNHSCFPMDIGHIAGMQNRPPLPVKKLIAFSEDQAKAIAEFRFEKRISSEREAIRYLIDIGLDAAAQQPQEVQ
jgi:hypothetical protein